MNKPTSRGRKTAGAATRVELAGDRNYSAIVGVPIRQRTGRAAGVSPCSVETVTQSSRFLRWGPARVRPAGEGRVVERA